MFATWSAPSNASDSKIAKLESHGQDDGRETWGLSGSTATSPSNATASNVL